MMKNMEYVRFYKPSENYHPDVTHTDSIQQFNFIIELFRGI